MPTNVEIKARIRDWRAVEARAAALSGAPAEVLEQEDTFFAVPRGRLKLRVFAGGEGQLIHYRRLDAAGPKESEFRIFPVSAPESLKALLGAALGVRGAVRKRRYLYRTGRTRIHLDEVEGLGQFLELEVVLGEGDSPERGAARARELMAELGVGEEDLVGGAYIDLLERSSASP